MKNTQLGNFLHECPAYATDTALVVDSVTSQLSPGTAAKHSSVVPSRWDASLHFKSSVKAVGMV